MAIAEDVSSPAVRTAGSGATLVTASFSPPAKSLLVVMAGIAWAAGTGNVVISDSGSHFWTNGVFLASSGSNDGVAVVAYTYLAAVPGSITVTGTFTNVSGGEIMAVKVLTGAAAVQTGAGSGSAYQATSTDGTVSVTTTVVGSVVYGISGDPNSNDTFTVNGATSLVNLFGDAGNGDAIAAWGSSAPTVTPGATAFGGTWGSAVQGTAAGLEILPYFPPAPRSLIVSRALRRSTLY